jgi:hypothetical protein
MPIHFNVVIEAQTLAFGGGVVIKGGNVPVKV